MSGGGRVREAAMLLQRRGLLPQQRETGRELRRRAHTISKGSLFAAVFCSASRAVQETGAPNWAYSSC
jgi:hypothetical protein